MDMYGGYYMVSLAGADLAETSPVYIQGAYQAVYKGIHTDKPILIYHVVYGDIKLSPMYGILSKENNILYLKTLYALIEITSADQVVIIPTPSIDDVEAEIELIRIELGNLTGQITDITEAIDDMESEIDSVQGDVTDLQTDLATVSGKADQALAAAQQAARDLNDLTDVVADLSGDVVDLTRDVTALTGTVTTLSGTVNTLSGDVNTLSGDVNTLSGTVTTLSGTVNTLSGNVNTLSGRVTAVESEVSDLADDLADEIAYTHSGGLFTALLDFFYPVGSYYETSDADFNPNTEWGGTWVLETSGVVHTSAGYYFPLRGAPTDTIDGGSVEHNHLTEDFTLLADHIPAHTHGNKSLTGSATFRKWTASGHLFLGRTGIITSVSGEVSATGYPIQSLGGTTPKLDQLSIDASHTHDSVGGGQPHNHGATRYASSYPRHINVNRWHRRA